MGKTTKILVLGAKNTGKTTLVERLIHNQDSIPQTFATIEDIYYATIETEKGTREKLKFFDLGGIDYGKRDIPLHFIYYADVFLLVYCINDKNSFLLLDAIKKDIEKAREKKEVQILVLGSKSDLDSQRQVDHKTALNWASKEKVKLYEVSAFRKNTIMDPIFNFISKLNPPTTRSTFPQLTIPSISKKSRGGDIS